MDRLDEYGRTETMRKLTAERDWERTRANAHRDKVVSLSEQLRRARKQPRLAFVCGCLCGVFFLGTLVALVQAYKEDGERVNRCGPDHVIVELRTQCLNNEETH